mgnify:CR=1 FL=1
MTCIAITTKQNSHLSDEERFAPVPKIAVLIYMLETKQVVGITDDVGEDII